MTLDVVESTFQVKYWPSNRKINFNEIKNIFEEKIDKTSGHDLTSCRIIITICKHRDKITELKNICLPII